MSFILDAKASIVEQRRSQRIDDADQHRLMRAARPASPGRQPSWHQPALAHLGILARLGQRDFFARLRRRPTGIVTTAAVIEPTIE